MAPLDGAAYERWIAEETLKELHEQYSAFQRYDFDHDPDFQAGLPLLLEKLSRQNVRGLELEGHLAQSKMFYFDRCAPRSAPPPSLRALAHVKAPAP